MLIHLELIAFINEQYTKPVEIMNYKDVVVFLKNKGSFPISWGLEISPDSENFLRENIFTTTNPGCLQRLILSIPAPFLRVRYKSEFYSSLFDLWIYYF